VLALPRPGRIRELLALASQLHSNHLDRARPLWEYYIIDGVEGGRVAVYTKIHHAMVDGVAAMRMLMKSMSEDPAARRLPAIWAKPLHSSGDTADGARAARQGPYAALAHAAQAARAQIGGLPFVALGLYGKFKEALSNGDLASGFLAPRCILNQRVNASRRFAIRWIASAAPARRTPRRSTTWCSPGAARRCGSICKSSTRCPRNRWWRWCRSRCAVTTPPPATRWRCCWPASARI
jgi:diacylglycerol O-acyltransferase